MISAVLHSKQQLRYDAVEEIYPIMALPANFFENLFVTLLAAAESVVPIFVHSKQGVLVLNATEPIFNAALAQITTNAQAASTPPPAAPAAPAAA